MDGVSCVRSHSMILESARNIVDCLRWLAHRSMWCGLTKCCRRAAR